MIVTCDQCEVKFKRKPSEIGKHTYCSVECFHAHMNEDGTINGNYRGGKNVPCTECGKDHYRIPCELKSDRLFCSVKCCGKWNSKHRTGPNSTNYKGYSAPKRCASCGTPFQSSRLAALYCSSGCWGDAKTKNGTSVRECLNCHEEYRISNSAVIWRKLRSGGAVFCSKKCQTQYKVGANHQAFIQNRAELKNRFKTLRASFGMKAWRKHVFERDHYTCQDCGATGGELNAHHIKHFAHYPELRLDISNGRTLCVLCHRKYHVGGRKTKAYRKYLRKIEPQMI